MSTMIDLIGSAIIAGYVVMIGLGLNMNVNSAAVASTTTVTTQEFIVAAAQTLESDLKRMGFGLPDPIYTVALADSNRIRFRADMNRDGIIDSVEWYTAAHVTKANGLTVRTLFRKYNDGPPFVIATNVKTFTLKYLDQDGTATTTLTAIAMIESTLEISSPYQVADQVNPDNQDFVTTIWRQTRLASRNLRRHG